MTWNEWSVGGQSNLSADDLESRVLAKLGGRLQEFVVDEVDGELIVRGKATSQHVKQLAVYELMRLTRRPIISNRIEVASPAALIL